MASLRRALASLISRRSPGSRAPGAPATGVVEQPAVPDPTAQWRYAPEADGEPDAGEVVWAWVPYEDDPARGKDRPVLLLAQRDDTWLGLALTSKDHDRDAADEARWGRHWMDVGAGAWDSRRRPSEVRLDRLVHLERDAIRREGAALDRPVFEAVLAAARRHHALDPDH